MTEDNELLEPDGSLDSDAIQSFDIDPDDQLENALVETGETLTELHDGVCDAFQKVGECMEELSGLDIEGDVSARERWGYPSWPSPDLQGDDRLTVLNLQEKVDHLREAVDELWFAVLEVVPKEDYCE